MEWKAAWAAETETRMRTLELEPPKLNATRAAVQIVERFAVIQRFQLLKMIRAGADA